MNTPFPPIFYLLMQVPYYVVVVAGIVLSLVWWKRTPLVSLWAMLGFSCLLAAGLAGFAMAPFLDLLNRVLGTGGSSTQHSLVVFFSAGVTLLSAAGLAMLIVAVFGWRQSSTQSR